MATVTPAIDLCLRLYVAGSAPNSLRAIQNAEAICSEHFAGCHQLEIVDMLKEPLRALADGIIVTPTLVRVAPLPLRRIVGTLADTGNVLMVLGAQ